ncbi:hypothetical protein [uncultured Victivallis sp.]|uniref:hypothetical protein n=1 Tax=uncultured Victivallis sp. TaxID=354118 RepID=UPI002591BCCB|nr:hypothetical protein [uncultured Victivallis sp.]
MGEELKECPFCEGTVSIAYHCAGNNLLYCQDCKRTFSERDAKIIKLNARIAELEDTVRKLTGKERFRGDETILYAAHKETISYKDKQIAELEKRVEACRLANHLLEQERNELEAERDRLRETLQDEHITSNARREKIIVLKAERDRLRKALRGLMQAVDGCLTPHEALLWKKCEEAMKGAGE